MSTKYIPSQIEKKWQEQWKKDKLYKFPHFAKASRGKQGTKKKYYTLVELPYTSGDLHIGHWFTFVTPDAVSRFWRMKGYDVFFPHGYDTIGLPAENAAIKRGIHPRDWTLKNIATMQAQFETMGGMIDLEDPVITCTDEYFKWNQWIFIKMFEKGVAYRGKALSNWCPVDKTVLADEHVEGGKCWRCGSIVEKKEVAQWFLKITKYADELIWPHSAEASFVGGTPEKLEVDWPKPVREGQNNWIGKKEGINIYYKIQGTKEEITCFTTRPDTNFGATFIVIAPEHEFVQRILDEKLKTEDTDLKKIKEYVQKTASKSELDRLAEGRKKTGVFTGFYAINNLNGKKMPVWVSDFVLAGFGTGAVVGVPGHDLRDFEFAKEFGIDIIRVVAGKDGDTSPITHEKQVQEKEGKMINSDFLNGLDIHTATKKVMDYLEKEGFGKRIINYHIRDWSISRQRYWGTPVPMIHCEACGIVPVPLKDLPVTLPYEVDFTPTGKPPLATNEKWMRVKCPKCGKDAKRDPETLDTFFDSAWYYYRYTSPHYTNGPFDKDQVKNLMPVDVYFGGAEHTLGHTLYARFFTKFFKDLGLVTFDEFAKKRVQHGIVLGPDGNKMSKSKGNVINPDDMVKEYGADAVRLYLAFMMPYDGTAPWSTEAIQGMHRFLQRVWGLQEKLETRNSKLETQDLVMMNKTIKKVGEDLEEIKANTAIAAIMEWLNHLSKKDGVSNIEYQTLLILLAPFAPHITEELFQELRIKNNELRKDKNHNSHFIIHNSIHSQSWPKVDKDSLKTSEVKVPVQVNGKLRGVVEISVEASKEQVVEKALTDEKVKKYLEEKKYEVIYVPGKILNFVIE